jgi:hypothetical protein
VIRIANGTVNKIAKLFVEVFAGIQIRVGALILLSSVSHLAAVGVAAYTESFVRAAKFLMTSFSDKVAVRPGVPVLLGGIRDPALMRSMMDLAAWTDSLMSKEQSPQEARKALSLCIQDRATGPAVTAEKLLVQLPVGVLTFEKKAL